LLPQVSDVENVLGIVQTENIQVLAETYDVALDISISKGQWLPPEQRSQVHCFAFADGQPKHLGWGEIAWKCDTGTESTCLTSCVG